MVAVLTSQISQVVPLGTVSVADRVPAFEVKVEVKT